MRTRTMALILTVLAATLLGWTTSAAAQDDDHSDEQPGITTTPFSIPEEGIGIDQGIFVSGAVVTPLEGGETRTMDDYEAATFMQSWLGAAFFGSPGDVEDPPPDLPVFRIDIAGTWQNNPGNVTAYYATDGEVAYIGFPGFVVWTDPAEMPPPSNWFKPLPRVIDAFNGDAELLDSTGRELATSIPGSGGGGTSAGSSSETDFPWIWVAVGIGVAVVLAGAYVLRRRRSQPAETAPPTDALT